MKLRSKRTILVLVGVLAVAVFAAVGAYAYWTTSGSGSGSASAGSPSAVVVNQTSSISDLYPGGPTKALAGNFDNPNDGPAYVTSVNASISSVTGPNIDGTHPCAAADFQLNGFPVSVGQDVPAGTAKGSWSGASIQMLDSGSNQDGCKGATVHLSYTSN